MCDWYEPFSSDTRPQWEQTYFSQWDDDGDDDLERSWCSDDDYQFIDEVISECQKFYGDQYDTNSIINKAEIEDELIIEMVKHAVSKRIYDIIQCCQDFYQVKYNVDSIVAKKKATEEVFNANLDKEMNRKEMNRKEINEEQSSWYNWFGNMLTWSNKIT